MKKIMFVIGMLALVISCKMPNDYSDTDASNQIQIENPSSEITDDEEKPSSEIEDENNDEENKPSNPIEDDFKLENDSCEIDKNITPNDLMKFNYFIRFNNEEKLINENEIEEWTDPYSNNFNHLEIHTSINEYTFDLWITKSENKLKVLKHNGGNPTLKSVYLENGNEIHIVF